MYRKFCYSDLSVDNPIQSNIGSEQVIPFSENLQDTNQLSGNIPSSFSYDPALLNTSSFDDFISGNELAAAIKNIEILYPQSTTSSKTSGSKRNIPSYELHKPVAAEPKRAKTWDLLAPADKKRISKPSTIAREGANSDAFFTMGSDERAKSRTNKKVIVRAIKKVIPKDGIKKTLSYGRGSSKKGARVSTNQTSSQKNHVRDQGNNSNAEALGYRPIMPKESFSARKLAPEEARAKQGKIRMNLRGRPSLCKILGPKPSLFLYPRLLYPFGSDGILIRITEDPEERNTHPSWKSHAFGVIP